MFVQAWEEGSRDRPHMLGFMVDEYIRIHDGRIQVLDVDGFHNLNGVSNT